MFTLAALAVFSLSAFSQAQFTKELPAILDNSMFAEDGALSNGVGPFLFTGYNGANDERRLLIKFPISDSIPADATIDDVTLTLYCTNAANGSGTVSLQINMVDTTGNGVWGEGASNSGTVNPGQGAAAQAGDATWTHRNHPNDTWTAGGAFNFAVTATAQSTGANQFVTFNSTGNALIADVQAWVTNPSWNNGWIMMNNTLDPNSQQAGTGRQYASREYTAGPASQRPKLTITYTADTTGNGGGTGIGENSIRNTVRVYPNPAREQVTIVSQQRVINASLLDVSGREVRAISVTELASNQGILSLAGLNSGVYFIRIESETGETVKRLIVE